MRSAILGLIMGSAVNAIPPLPEGDYFPLKEDYHWIYQGSSSGASRFNGASSQSFKRYISIRYDKIWNDTSTYTLIYTDSIYSRIHSNEKGAAFLSDTVKTGQYTIYQLKNKDIVFPAGNIGFFASMFVRQGQNLFKAYRDTLDGSEVQVYYEGGSNHQITRLENIGIWTYSYNLNGSFGPFNTYIEKDSLLEYSRKARISIFRSRELVSGYKKSGMVLEKYCDMLGRPKKIQNATIPYFKVNHSK